MASTQVTRVTSLLKDLTEDCTLNVLYIYVHISLYFVNFHIHRSVNAKQGSTSHCSLHAVFNPLLKWHFVHSTTQSHSPSLSHTHHTQMGFGASQIRYWWHRTHSATLFLSLSLSLSLTHTHTHTCRKKKTGGRGVIYIPKARHSTSTKCTQTMPTFTLVRKDHTITYHLFHVIESRTIFDMISWGFAKGFYHKMYSMWI